MMTGRIQKQILNALGKRSMTIKEIVAETNLSHTKVMVSLTRLVNKNYVDLSPSGRWRCSNTPTDTVDHLTADIEAMRDHIRCLENHLTGITYDTMILAPDDALLFWLDPADGKYRLMHKTMTRALCMGDLRAAVQDLYKE